MRANILSYLTKEYFLGGCNYVVRFNTILCFVFSILMSTRDLPILNRFAAIREYHVYNLTWKPQVGEILSTAQERRNLFDKYAVSILMISILQLLYSRTWLYGTSLCGTPVCMGQFPWYGETFFALHKPWLCGTPGYVGQFGWPVECPIYPGSTVIRSAI